MRWGEAKMRTEQIFREMDMNKERRSMSASIVHGTEMTPEEIQGLRMFQARVGQWNDYNFPNKRGSDQPFKGMVEELGELAHSDLKMEQGIRGSAVEHEAKGKDAMGDLFVYMCDYCNQRGWSVAECIQQAWDDIKDRDWPRYPKNGRTE